MAFVEVKEAAASFDVLTLDVEFEGDQGRKNIEDLRKTVWYLCSRYPVELYIVMTTEEQHKANAGTILSSAKGQPIRYLHPGKDDALTLATLAIAEKARLRVVFDENARKAAESGVYKLKRSVTPSLVRSNTKRHTASNTTTRSTSAGKLVSSSNSTARTRVLQTAQAAAQREKAAVSEKTTIRKQTPNKQHPASPAKVTPERKTPVTRGGRPMRTISPRPDIQGAGALPQEPAVNSVLPASDTNTVAEITTTTDLITAMDASHSDAICESAVGLASTPPPPIGAPPASGRSLLTPKPSFRAYNSTTSPKEAANPSEIPQTAGLDSDAGKAVGVTAQAVELASEGPVAIVTATPVDANNNADITTTASQDHENAVDVSTGVGATSTGLEPVVADPVAITPAVPEPIATTATTTTNTSADTTIATTATIDAAASSTTSQSTVTTVVAAHSATLMSPPALKPMLRLPESPALITTNNTTSATAPQDAEATSFKKKRGMSLIFQAAQTLVSGDEVKLLRKGVDEESSDEDAPVAKPLNSSTNSNTATPPPVSARSELQSSRRSSTTAKGKLAAVALGLDDSDNEDDAAVGKTSAAKIEAEIARQTADAEKPSLASVVKAITFARSLASKAREGAHRRQSDTTDKLTPGVAAIVQGDNADTTDKSDNAAPGLAAISSAHKFAKILKDKANRRMSAPDSAAMKAALLFGSDEAIHELDDEMSAADIPKGALASGAPAREALDAYLKSPLPSSKPGFFADHPKSAREAPSRLRGASGVTEDE